MFIGLIIALVINILLFYWIIKVEIKNMKLKDQLYFYKARDSMLVCTQKILEKKLLKSQ